MLGAISPASTATTVITPTRAIRLFFLVPTWFPPGHRDGLLAEPVPCHVIQSRTLPASVGRVWARRSSVLREGKFLADELFGQRPKPCRRVAVARPRRVLIGH